jgi:hypothetical protein
MMYLIAFLIFSLDYTLGKRGEAVANELKRLADVAEREESRKKKKREAKNGRSIL